MTHVRFRQVVPVTLPPGESTELERLPVVGGELVVHLTPDGAVSSMGGRLAAGLATVLPAVPAERDAPA